MVKLEVHPSQGAGEAEGANAWVVLAGRAVNVLVVLAGQRVVLRLVSVTRRALKSPRPAGASQFRS